MTITADLITNLQKEFDDASRRSPGDFLNGKDRRPSYPFISGDGFRAMCEYRCEDKYDGCNFSPAQVKTGGCIYVATTDLKTFSTTSKYLHALENMIQQIPNKFVVVSHNGDMSTPDGDYWHQQEGIPQLYLRYSYVNPM